MTPSAKLLVIEGKHADCPVFVPALRKKGFETESAPSGSEALKLLGKKHSFDAVIVNAASLRTSGKRICRLLREKAGKLPIVLIQTASDEITKSDADVVLSLPFTVQKLVNRIRQLLPCDGRDSLHAGPIRLDVENRVVVSLGKRARLTPRLVRLLKMLMERRGEVIDRKELFSYVWETDYTDDTRTLDVHISWLREAIEADPKKPKFLKTVRGVGYRLDV
ncbi:MAG: response regulator transcription factor [Anaerolineales bacterium]